MIWNYIIFSYVTLFLYGLADNIRGPLLPEIMKTYGLNHSQGSLIFAVSSIVGVVSSILAQRIIKKLGLLKALTFACLFLAAGYFLVFWAHDFTLMLAGIALFGFSMGLLGVTQNIMGSVAAPPEKRRKVLSGLHSMYGLSSFVAPFVVTYAMIRFSDWRYSFLIVALFCVVIIVSLLFSRERPSPVEEDLAPTTPYKATLRSWFDGLTLALYVGAEILVSSRIASFSRENFNYDFAQASQLVSYFFAFLLAGRLFFMFFQSPLSTKNSLFLSLILSLIFLYLGLEFHPLWLALTGLSMSLFYPFIITYLSEKYQTHVSQVISKALILQSICIVLMHLGVGLLSDGLGLKKALMVGYAFLAIPILLLLTSKEKSS